MRCATKLIQTSISKPKINFKKPKLTTKIKNHQRKLTFLYRQNALPLAYRYARHARHTNMHTVNVFGTKMRCFPLVSESHIM